MIFNQRKKPESFNLLLGTANLISNVALGQIFSNSVKNAHQVKTSLIKQYEIE